MARYSGNSWLTGVANKNRCALSTRTAVAPS
jgi:hypothetical protein